MDVRVSACFTYPLKSGKGIEVARLVLDQRGPRHDRLWMLVHAEPEKQGLFITQRDRGCEKLALVQALPGEGGVLSIAAPGRPGITVSGDGYFRFSGAVEIWGEFCEALDAGDEAAGWFSEYLGFPCRLVRIPDDFVRPTEPEYSRPGDQVGFADKYPVLVTNTASLEALRAKMDRSETVNMERFRPNVVLDGLEAFEEDVVCRIRIGEVDLEFVKPSIRCKITRIDQETAEMPSEEPLATLRRLRHGNAEGLKGVFFGQNAIPRSVGEIRMGDTVEILSRKSLPPALKEVSLGYKP